MCSHKHDSFACLPITPDVAHSQDIVGRSHHSTNNMYNYTCKVYVQLPYALKKEKNEICRAISPQSYACEWGKSLLIHAS